MFRAHIQVKNTLTARSKRLIKDYRLILMKSLSRYMDDVRSKAIDEIIPSKWPANDPTRQDVSKMIRFQPSTPGKLTSRTGALVKMLKDTSTWSSRSARSMVTSGGALDGSIKVTSKGTSLIETFEGAWKANVKTDARYWPWISGKRPKKQSARPTMQQLYFRFRWENGLRGSKREFFLPAAKKIYYSTERIIQMQLDHLDKIGAIKYI